MNKETYTKGIKQNDVVYYARIMPKLSIYDVHDLKIRSTKDTYFVGVDVRNKHSFIFSYKDINKVIFLNRGDAVLKVKEAEKNEPKINTETHYEEY